MTELILPYKYKYSVGIGKSDAAEVIEKFPESTPPAMAYVPFQQWEEPYAPNKALSAGTIFPSLDLPFTGKEAKA